GALDPVRPLRRTARRAPARRPSVRREHALQGRPRTRAGDRLRLRPGAPSVKRFEDPGAEFIPAVERVFGERPRILDGSRAVLLGEIKLQLEAGERELWLIERRGALEHRLGYVPVHGSIEDAVRQAKEQIDG